MGALNVLIKLHNPNLIFNNKIYKDQTAIANGFNIFLLM